VRAVVTGFLLLAIVAACTQKEKTNLVVKRDKKGNIVSEIPYIRDSIKHGLARYYYANGDIRGEIRFVNGKRDSMVNYRIGGGIESRTYFKNNLNESYVYWYYPNGNLESKSRWIKGIQYGSVYLYDSMGSMIQYNCKDRSEITFYDVRWDKIGNKLLEEGVVFSPIFYLENADSIGTVRVNKEAVVQITVANPPETASKLWMGEVISEGKVENFKELQIENNTATYKRTFTKAGKYTLTAVGEIKDKSGKVIKEDRATNVIRVIE
jgi:antitoxin component YwqK of YwqJK toxin-antitoxin module